MPAADLVAWLPAAPQFALSDGQIRTWPGALAYHWARQQRVEPAVAAEDCPLGRFLQRHAAADTQALGWHAALHAPSSETDRRRARDALLQWLGRKVREAYGGL